jgi:hypothetical protein
VKTTAYVPPEGAKVAAIDGGQEPAARPNGDGGNRLAGERQGARSRKQKQLPPPPDRASLTISAWLDRPIPERDYLHNVAMVCHWRDGNREDAIRRHNRRRLR